MSGQKRRGIDHKKVKFDRRRGMYINASSEIAIHQFSIVVSRLINVGIVIHILRRASCWLSQQQGDNSDRHNC